MDTKKIREFLLSSQEEIRDEHLTLTASQEISEAVEQVESELVDDYVLDLLSRQDKEAFERNYLVTEARRRRLTLARDLLILALLEHESGGAVPDKKTGKRFLGRVAIAAASLTIALIGIYFSLQKGATDNPQLVISETAVETATPQQMENTVAEAKENAPEDIKESDSRFTPATITLSPGLLRSGGNEIVLSQEETRVPFLMKLLTEPGARTFSNYSMKVETPEGNPVTTSTTIVRIAKNSVTVSVVGKFSNGTYIVYLTGVDVEGGEEILAEYSFRVVAQ